MKQHLRVLCVAPTGSGKTVIGAAHVAARDERVLWLAHRRELIDQARDALLKAGVPAGDIGIISGERRENENARILVGSCQMYIRKDVPEVDLIVIDEAHRSAAKTYVDILAKHKGPVIGLTATPWRLDGKPLGDAFDDLVVMATLGELIELGHLPQPKIYGILDDVACELVADMGQGKEFSKKGLKKASRKKILQGDVVEQCQRWAPGARTLVFAIDRAHGRDLCRRFVEAGRVSEYLDGKTPSKEREAMLQRFGSGETEMLVTVDVLTEGYDCPAVECIVIARPTKSLVLHLQMCGRGMRKFGEKRPIILDHGGNCGWLELPTHAHKWSLDRSAPEARLGEGCSAVRTCPECSLLAPAGAVVCECGAELPRTPREIEREIEERKVQLQRIDLERAEIAEIARKRGVLHKMGSRDLTGKTLKDWVDGRMAAIQKGKA